VYEADGGVMESVYTWKENDFNFRGEWLWLVQLLADILTTAVTTT
jgi:hypothetical protein